MEKNPVVSIIIPVYNVEQYIESCCRSVFSQTYDNIEVIIVNDGTPDRSIEIVEKMLEGRFARIKPRVKIINQENQGLPGARRTGLAHATGEYLIQFDPDDRPSRRIIKKMVAAAEKEDADMVICGYYNVYKFWKVPRREKYYPDKMQILDAMFSHKHFRAFVWNKMVRRSLYDEKSFMFPRCFMCEDLVLMAQFILRADKIVYIKDKLYNYKKTRLSTLPEEVLKKRAREVFTNEVELWNFLDKDGNTPLAPIKDDYMLQLAWVAVRWKVPELLNDYPDVLEYVRNLPIDRKYSLEVEHQMLLKEIAGKK